MGPRVVGSAEVDGLARLAAGAGIANLETAQPALQVIVSEASGIAPPIGPTKDDARSMRSRVVSFETGRKR